MGLCMKGSGMAMTRFISLEPRLGMESLGLLEINIHPQICVKEI
jgi:hypothetical protein